MIKVIQVTQEVNLHWRMENKNNFQKQFFKLISNCNLLEVAQVLVSEDSLKLIQKHSKGNSCHACQKASD